MVSPVCLSAMMYFDPNRNQVSRDDHPTRVCRTPSDPLTDSDSLRRIIVANAS